MPDQKEAVRRAYDEMGEVYAAERASEIGLLDELTDRISGEARILDAGCGQGEPVTAYLSGQFDVVGVDFSRGQLHLARKTAPEAALV